MNNKQEIVPNESHEQLITELILLYASHTFCTSIRSNKRKKERKERRKKGRKKERTRKAIFYMLIVLRKLRKGEKNLIIFIFYHSIMTPAMQAHHLLDRFLKNSKKL